MQVVVNVGGHFNSQKGFTAPISGLYFMTLTVGRMNQDLNVRMISRGLTVMTIQSMGRQVPEEKENEAPLIMVAESLPNTCFFF